MITRRSMFVLPAVLLIASGCATTQTQSAPRAEALTGVHSTQAIPAACFPVESLPPADRALADTLLTQGLDNEALFTLAGHLKPISSVPLIQTATAKRPGVPDGAREVADPASPDLERVARYQRVANALTCGPIRMVIAPYRMVQDTVRRLQVVFVHSGLLDAELTRNAAFWGQWGFVPGSDPAVVINTVEFETSYDRFRGYGYLFGYPEHAVTFFVEAAREGDARGELVARDFFQIPVHSRPDARFVYAVPKGHEPLPVDLAIRDEAARVLADYRARRPRFENADGTLRAVELLRAWYAEQQHRQH